MELPKELTEEHKLIIRANEVMRILREKYDKTYGWCPDCDDMVVKESECCLNELDSSVEILFEDLD